MDRPDFACSDLGRLPQSDLRFLVEHMPRAGNSYQEIAQMVGELPNTLESMLTSDYVVQLIRDRERQILQISPFLLFSVLLRRSLGAPRSPSERRVVNYLANLLTLFIDTERVYRVEPGDEQPSAYLWQLIERLPKGDARRQFVTYAHIGNYSLWLSGLQAPWIEHRYRYHRRLVDSRYYRDFGRAYFDRAARHGIARELGIDDIFLRLALMFDHYRDGLDRMRREYMHAA